MNSTTRFETSGGLQAKLQRVMLSDYVWLIAYLGKFIGALGGGHQRNRSPLWDAMSVSQRKRRNTYHQTTKHFEANATADLEISALLMQDGLV